MLHRFPVMRTITVGALSGNTQKLRRLQIVSLFHKLLDKVSVLHFVAQKSGIVTLVLIHKPQDPFDTRIIFRLTYIS